MANRDIILIGGSAGAVEVLKALASGLPADFPAALFVVVHTRAGFEGLLPEILSRAGRLPANHALHGEPIVPGHIYVAPADSHLLVRPGYVAVQRGPKVNGFRPAVDPLFQSGAVAYQARVMAVVISGNLDCGTIGLMSVKARGGLAIIQDPGEATAADMPRSAAEHVQVDHVVRAAELAPLLIKLTKERLPETTIAPMPSELDALEGDRPGRRSDVVCPLCQGALTEAQLNGVMSFRCHVGHAFSPATLLAEQAESLERALWAAVRALEESAQLTKRVAAPDADIRARLAEKGRTQGYQADVIRRMLLGNGSLSVNDATQGAGENEIKPTPR